MSGLLDIIKNFTVKVTRQNGEGLAGATIQVLNSSGANVSNTLFGATPAVTDSYGVFEKFLSPVQRVPANTYTIQVSAPGYGIGQVSTASTFVGPGSFTLSLSRSTVSGEYNVDAPTSLFVSPLYPVVFATTVSELHPYELIQYEVSHSDGRTSKINVPVDVTTLTADADIRARIRLAVRPWLVADGDTALADPDFSDTITVQAYSLTDDGAVPVGEPSTLYAANLVPPGVPTPGSANTLSAYASPGANQLIRWISLLREPVANRGFYFDTMIWLSDPEKAYTVNIRYRDGANDPVGDTEQHLVMGSRNVQRIRLDTDVDTLIRSAQLWITDSNDQVLSDTLTVRYR